MIVFRGLRVGGVAPAMSGHRQAALEPSGGREKRPCGRPCRLLRSRRAVLVMERQRKDRAPGLKNLQGRQMCHPSMKVSTGTKEDIIQVEGTSHRRLRGMTRALPGPRAGRQNP